MLQVIVVDMLEGFTRVGPLASPRVDRLVPGMAAFLAALPSGSLVVFLADAHEPDSFEFRRFPPHCVRGTLEAQVRPELLEAARASGARVRIVCKDSFSGFCGTDLDAIVRAAASRDWIVVGCVTDCCVEMCVAELVCRGRTVTVVRELVDTWDTTPEQAERAGLGPAYVHEAERINDEWFSRRLPAIWGARVVERWPDALPGGGSGT